MKQIPEDVYEVINFPNEGFDKMYYKFLQTYRAEIAFQKAEERIRVYFPNWYRYKNYNTYVEVKSRRVRKMMLKNKRKNK